jgi:hypothetical protein
VSSGMSGDASPDMSAFGELSQRPPRPDTPAKDTAALILLLIAIVGGVIELFYKPFGIGPIAFLCALVGMAISEKRRRLGLWTTLAITVAFVVGASICVWYSNPLY